MYLVLSLREELETEQGVDVNVTSKDIAGVMLVFKNKKSAIKFFPNSRIVEVVREK